MTPASDRGAAVMTIGELSRRTGMSAKALRRLEAMGLLCTPARSRAGHRLFDESALWCVHQVLQLRAIGLTTAEIRDLFADYYTQPDEPHLARRLRGVRARVDARIAELQELRRRIDAFEAGNQGALRSRGDAGLFAGNPHHDHPGTAA